MLKALFLAFGGIVFLSLIVVGLAYLSMIAAERFYWAVFYGDDE